MPNGSWRSRRPVAAMRITAGRVKNHSTTTSQIVVTPRYRAKPRTEPTLRTNSTAAAMNETRLAARIVRHVEAKLRAAELRNVRPCSTSSFIRSKYTT